MLQSPSRPVDAAGASRLPQPKQHFTCSSFIFRGPLRNGRTSTATSVAAPERNSLTPAPDAPRVVFTEQQRNEIAAMLSASLDTRQPQQVDGPLSPPSTSGRSLAAAGDHQDRPFLPGSRRRLRNAVSRRNLSTASFYGEYCDMTATQRMVSTIWERLMAQGGVSTELDATASAAANDPIATTTAPAAEPPAPQRQRARQSISAAAAAGATADAAASPDSDGQLGPIAAAANGETSTSASSSSASSGTTAAARPLPVLADGWSVTPTAVAKTAATPAAPARTAAPKSHKRVVLYLGPEFELQLPPPLVPGVAPYADVWSDAGGSVAAADADGDGVDLGPSWNDSERELLEGASVSPPAPKPPRRVRGCGLSSPELVRAVSFESGGAEAAGVRAGEAERMQRQRGRPRGRSGSAEKAAEKAKRGAGGATSRQSQGRTRKTTAAGGSGGSSGGAEAAASVNAPGDTRAVAATANTVDAVISTPARNGGASGSSLPQPQQHSSSSSDGAGVAAGGGGGWGVEPRQKARQRDLLEALVGRAGDAEVAERIQALATVNRTGVTAINFVLQALGTMGHVHALGRLLTLQVALGLSNEHTYATAFRSLYKAGRLGMVLAAFEEACRSGRDLGPVACSALLHIAGQERNIKLAWKLFDQMVAHEMTLNRYSYNCMAHIASQYGALDDVRLIYTMMRSEAAEAAKASSSTSASPTSSPSRPRHDCSPDSYTFSALVRTAVNAGRGDLLPALFNEMVASQRAADRAVGRPRPLAPGQGEGRLTHEVWGHFICAASRSGQPDLALRFFHAGMWELGLLPNREVYNILLAGLAKSRPLPELLRLYTEMVNGCLRPVLSRGVDTGASGPHGDGGEPDSGHDNSADRTSELPPGTVVQPPLVPDAYTFNALLTAAAHHMAELPTLERIRREMARHRVALNAHVGTSLINAYRRTPELGSAAAAAAAAAVAADAVADADRVVAAAEDVMSELLRSGVANDMSYTCMAALYATAQRPTEALGCLRDMMAAGLVADDSAWQFVAAAAADAGQFALVGPIHAARQRQQAQRQEVQQQQRQQQQAQQQRRAAPGFLRQEGYQQQQREQRGH